MSLAPSSHPSLYTSPVPLTKAVLIKQSTCTTTCSFFQTKPCFSLTNGSYLSNSSIFTNTLLLKPSILILKASETEAQTEESGGSSQEGEGGEEQAYEEYEVEIVQPYGLRFAKGRDGGTYIDAIAPGGSADLTGKFTVGDRVLATRFLVFALP